MEAIRDEYGRRPLTDFEREELLDRALAGVWLTLTPAGRIHSVPVHFVRRDAQLRVLTNSDSVECRNVRRTGRATLCVETILDGNDRRFVGAEGPVRVEESVSLDDVAALDRRYDRHDAGDLAAYEASVILVLEPERWMSDAD